MGKQIRLERAELVWETRINYFGEKEWEETKKYYKCYTSTANYNAYMARIYKQIKDITWEQVLAKWESDEPSIYIELSENGYKESLRSFVEDTIREINYQCDIDSETYADDYEEDFDILEVSEDGLEVEEPTAEKGNE